MTTEDALFAAAREKGLPVRVPAAPRDGWYDRAGMRLHYLIWPAHGNPPLVLLHGGTQTAHSWSFIALALHERFDVYAVDLRGHGDSDWSPDGSYRLSDYVHDALAFMEVVGRSPVTLVGLSLGARIALGAAILRPRAVDRLVLVDIGLASTPNSGRERIQRFREGPEEMEFDQFVRRAMEFNPKRSEESLRASLKHHLRQLPSGLWTWKYDRRFRTGGKTYEREPSLTSAAAASDVQTPTLVIRGAQSDVTPLAAARELAEALPNATLVEVPDAGHTVHGDNPLGFYQVLAPFLDGMRPPRQGTFRV